jgi:deoxyuridine 5'-triphosphate nucleotidohydrolase
MKVKFAPFDPEKPYFIPEKGTEGAAGHDIKASERVVLPSKTWGAVPTNLKFKFDKLVESSAGVGLPLFFEVYMRIAPRGGLSLKKGVDVFAGVVDEDWRGNTQVVLMNNADEDLVIEAGDKVAQLIMTLKMPTEFVEEEIPNDTDRGASGFGSTGR